MHAHNNVELSRRFILSLTLTGVIFIAEVIGGIWTGSLALLSDAAHVFMDVFALGLSFTALKLSERPADDRHTFGFHRVEVIAALINGVTLGVIAIGIFKEAYDRWLTPIAVKGLPMLLIAAIGLVVNLIVARILSQQGHGHPHTHEHNHHHADDFLQTDLNLKSAFLHVIGDAISSVGVILAGVVIYFTSWQWVDPLVSFLIGCMILFSSLRVVRSAIHILIEGVPESISIRSVEKSLQNVPGVLGTHDLHIWNICSGQVALSAHIVLDSTGADHSDTIRLQLNTLLRDEFHISHTTLQMEHTPCLMEPGSCR